MRSPIFVRTLSEEERKALESGLRSSDAFVLRRCQILLASARGERAPRIAENLGCGSQTVRNTIHDFNERGLGVLQAGSSRPKEVHAAFDAGKAESLREMLHHQPSNFGKESTFWTLAMAAKVSFEEPVAHQEPVAQRHRAQVDPRQTQGHGAREIAWRLRAC